MDIERRCSQSGVTLIELIVFIVIVSVGLAGVLSSLNISAMRSADPLQPKQALVIAEAKLEETLLQDYSAIAASTTTPVTGYTATVSVAGDTIGGVTALRVSVSVSTPSGSSYALTGYRTNY